MEGRAPRRAPDGGGGVEFDADRDEMGLGQTSELPSTRRGIELLATVKSVDAEGVVTNQCFGNILELGCDALVLESRREQSAGAALILNVVFPGQRPRSNPVVAFHCVVRRVRDPRRLHYDVAIEEMDDLARQGLIDFLTAPASAGRL